jgi:hypothetical protein
MNYEKVREQFHIAELQVWRPSAMWLLRELSTGLPATDPLRRRIHGLMDASIDRDSVEEMSYWTDEARAVLVLARRRVN